MKMYKCPDCGKTYTSMYCDICGKNIPSQYAVHGTSSSRNDVAEGADATNELLEKINNLESKNNTLLAQIEKHTKVVSTIMLISVILSGVSVLLAFIR